MSNGYWSEYDDLDFELDDDEIESTLHDDETDRLGAVGETLIGGEPDIEEEFVFETTDFGHQLFELSLREFETEEEFNRELDDGTGRDGAASTSSGAWQRRSARG